MTIATCFILFLGFSQFCDQKPEKATHLVELAVIKVHHPRIPPAAAAVPSVRAPARPAKSRPAARAANHEVVVQFDLEGRVACQVALDLDAAVDLCLKGKRRMFVIRWPVCMCACANNKIIVLTLVGGLPAR